ncbi:MAG: tryptophan 7-halogenase [Thermoanaerobaculia bacterium]
MSIETREELERPGALARALDEATAAVAGADGGEAAAERLGRLGAPAVLDAVLRLLLARALRGGAATGVDPGAVVGAARAAARRGLVPMATVSALRGTVRAVEGGLRDLGVWQPGVEWTPLPPPDDLEKLWDGLGGADGPAAPTLPDGAELAGALAAGTDAPGWLAWPGAVPGDLLRRLAGELRTAAAEGLLPLTPGGVGREGEVSERRHDAVLYATGLEDDLLRRAPATALLVQHLLERLEGPLRRALPERSLFAPQTAMLARYRAPCEGFAPHLDNPGGEADNGRVLSLILYLGEPEEPCRGGGLAVWAPGTSTAGPPAAVVAPEPGSAILFDARRVPHGVEPLEPGPDRWTLVVWLSERRRRPPRPLLPVPEVSPEEAFRAVDDPPVPEGTVVLRRLAGLGSGSGAGPGGAGAPVPRSGEGAGDGAVPPAGGEGSDADPTLVVRRLPGGAEPSEAPRVGIVATVASPGPQVEAWCRYHLELGASRLIVILDGDAENAPAGEGSGSPREAGNGRAVERLRRIAGPERLTVWTGAEARERWRGLPAPGGGELRPNRKPGGGELRPYREREGGGLGASGPAAEEIEALRRHAEGGSAAWAVAARQALNASAALQAARTGSFGPGAGGEAGADGEPLDWLLHLDGDELFHLEGPARGGATLAEHFAAVSREGWTAVRYVNHELLAPWPPGEPPRFKRNPALAAGRLGATGWRRLVECLDMAQDARRPYFRAYWNGKSAVAVAAGERAAGVHGWRVREGEQVFLAGPSVLHWHLPTAAAFRRKYLRIAAAPDGPARPFPPSPLEEAACSLARELRRGGAPEAEVASALDELYRATCTFTPPEVELLEEAGLLFAPPVPPWPLPEEAPAGGGGDGGGPPDDPPDDGEGAGRAAARRRLAELDRAGERRRAEAWEREPLRSAPAGAAAPHVEERTPAPRVVVLGGGTAGYLAALALRAKRPEVPVTLIESSQVPVIGVGEATTPLTPQFLHADLGVPVTDLFREVRPTFKLGIRFLWGGPEAPDDGAFPYPFGPVRPLEAAVWDGHLRSSSLQAALMAAGVLPVEPGPGNGAGPWRAAFGTEVAYHLDNRRLAAFLKRLAVARAVEVVDARIVHVPTGPGPGGEAEVQALVAEDGRRFTAELYLDCSGFRSLLVGEALGSPFVSYERSLFTDRAMIGPARPGDGLPPFTDARALSAGWCWSIPQEGEAHVGYVYSSAFAGAEEAAAELRRLHPAPPGGGDGSGALRELSFRPGRRAHFWKGNAVALGNAYGFVEPLESTALHLLIRQIGLLAQALPARRGESALARLVNARVAAFWDYVAWFLALHFRCNRGPDTPFWRTCREQADVSAHGELLDLFRERGPLSHDPAARRLFDFPDPLWGPEGIDTILLGQGVEARMPSPALGLGEWRRRTALFRRIAERSLSQEEVLAGLDGHPEVLEALAEEFRRRGPAFP